MTDCLGWGPRREGGLGVVESGPRQHGDTSLHMGGFVAGLHWLHTCMCRLVAACCRELYVGYMTAAVGVQQASLGQQEQQE
jgi:hypothetical protein